MAYTEQVPAQIVKLMTEGKSMAQVAAEFKICKKTLNNWAHKYPEVLEAISIGKTLAEAYWEDIGQKGIKGVLMKFNPSSWVYYMKCRFKEDWTESNEQKIELVDSVKKMSNEELDKLIKTLLVQKSKTGPSNSGAPCLIS